MKQLLLRKENLLLLLPAVMFIYHFVFIGFSPLDIRLHDTYIIIDNSFFYYILFMFLLLPCLFHYLLRRKKAGNNLILTLHIVITIALTVWIYVNFRNDFLTGLVGAPRQYYDISLNESFKISGERKALFYFYTLTLLSLLQLLFIIYALIMLLKRRR